MGPSNSSYLSNIAIFHFHDYGRKSIFLSLDLFNFLSSSPFVTLRFETIFHLVVSHEPFLLVPPGFWPQSPNLACEARFLCFFWLGEIFQEIFKSALGRRTYLDSCIRNCVCRLSFFILPRSYIDIHSP